MYRRNTRVGQSLKKDELKFRRIFLVTFSCYYTTTTITTYYFYY